MSASDAAPLPRAGEVFFDVRGESRTMRVSWYGDTGVAVFSIWNGGTCTGTFRLPIPELPRMIEALSNGPEGASPLPPTGYAAQQVPPGAADPGPPTAAMQIPRQVPGGPDYQDGPGYPGDQRVYQDQAGYAQPAAGYDDGYTGAPRGHENGYADFPRGYEEFPPEYADAGSGHEGPPPPNAGGRHGYGAPGHLPGQPGAAPAEGYQVPGGGYQSARPEAGHGELDADPGRPYIQPAASAGREPATAGQDGWGPRPDARHAQRAPSGPLPVGQWQGDLQRDEQGTGPYAGAGGPVGGHEGEAEPPYPGPGIDELGADPLEADYGGEAEQGFLPGPPTETFSPVAVGGSHSGGPSGGHSGGHGRQVGPPAGPGSADSRSARHGPPADDGYRPPPEDPEDAGGYSYARPGDSASESLAYHPGRPGRREREYRPSRDGY